MVKLADKHKANHIKHMQNLYSFMNSFTVSFYIVATHARRLPFLVHYAWSQLMV